MKYYVAKNNQSLGPYEVEEIRVKISAGELRASDPCVGDDGSTNWQPIATRLAGELPNLPPAPPPPPGSGGVPIFSPVVKEKLGFGFDQFFFLRRMLTPTFIQVIYVVGLVLIVLLYLTANYNMLFSDSGNPYAAYARYYGPPTGVWLLAYLVIFLVALLGWRIFCELLIVIFRIHNFLGEIRDIQASHPSPPSP